MTAESLATYPRMPPDGPHHKALGRWKANQLNFDRYTGGGNLSVAQFVLYRMRFILCGDLTAAWSDYGGLAAQLNNLARGFRGRPENRGNIRDRGEGAKQPGETGPMPF